MYSRVSHRQCVLGGVNTGDHHLVIGGLGLYFLVFSYLKSQRCFIFYCQLYFLATFFDALFLYFGLLVSKTFLTQKHVLLLTCKFLTDFLVKVKCFASWCMCLKGVIFHFDIAYSMNGTSLGTSFPTHPRQLHLYL